MRTLFKRRSARLLAASYAVALTSIATATYVVHHRTAESVERQDSLGTLINVSGRQRMLSQRLAYLRRVIETEDGTGGGLEALPAYLATLQEFLSAHDRLTRGDLLWRADHPRASDLRSVYYDRHLDNDLRRYAVEAELFAEAAETGRAPALPGRPDDLLGRLDQVTRLHEDAAQGLVEETRAFTQRALLVVMVLLLGEALIVVLPTARRIARVEDELTTLATTDGLTGVQNRRSLFGAAQGLMRLGARARRPLSVIVLDVDHFKRVNDEHGHAIGDDAIRHVVALAGGTLRDSDLIGRIGGEEFAIVCPETSPEGGRQVAEKVRAAIEAAPLTLEAGPLPLTVSLGVHSAIPHRQDVIEDFVAAADEALYDAKRNGRNRVEATAAESPALSVA